MKKEINIFIVAPSDVDEEREVVRDVCSSLDSQTDNTLKIQSISWKEFPMYYNNNPQKSIDKYFLKSDIYVVILWNRIGTIVEGLTGDISHSENVTGTQYEIESILAAKKESILFYLKDQEYQKVHIDEVEEIGKQKRQLNQFIDDIGLLKVPTQYGYRKFINVDEFRSLVTNHLSEILRSRYGITVNKLNMPHINIQDDKKIHYISGSYYAGLYIFLVLVALMISQTTNFLGTYTEDVRKMSTIFLLSLLVIVLIAVNALSVTQKEGSTSFINVAYALLRRGVFILFFSVLLSIYWWFYIAPLLTKFFL
jgi:hypothetical protein